MIIELPSLEFEVIDFKPESVLTESSIGFVISSLTSSGLAPLYCVTTIIMDMSMSGESSRSMPVID